MVSHHDSSDPLTICATPPPDEITEGDAAKKKRATEAQRIGDQIDEELRADELAFRKQEQMVKVLLLGQRGSGKSTLLKNFRMQFAREEWVQERACWKPVLQLNLVHSVNAILKALRDAFKFDNDDNDEPLPFTDKHHSLQLRLHPLCGVESDLRQLLGVKSVDILEHPPQTSLRLSLRTFTTSSEFYVRFHDWRSFLEASHSDGKEGSRRPIKHNGVSSQDITEVIASCKNDIMALWADDIIRKMLRRHKVPLEASTSFFLDNAERLTVRDYEPTDDDIIRARLHTPDIQEYELDVTIYKKLQKWKIYVLGLRSQRNALAWASYFDQEDPKVNRIEDSLISWKSICSSKLLSKTALIVIFNKTDILKSKIANGVMVKQHIPSYGDRPNDTQSVLEYFRQYFLNAFKHYSRGLQMCHVHFTSAIDTRTVMQIICSVSEAIIRKNLKNAKKV